VLRLGVDEKPANGWRARTERALELLGCAFLKGSPSVEHPIAGDELRRSSATSPSEPTICPGSLIARFEETRVLNLGRADCVERLIAIEADHAYKKGQGGQCISANGYTFPGDRTPLTCALAACSLPSRRPCDPARL